MNSFFHSASEFSGPVDHLARGLLLVCIFFVLLVWSLLIFFSVRYRASHHHVDRKNPPDKNFKLEFSLIATILIFGITTFGFSARLYLRMYSPPENSREVFGIGKQWMWVFHDPNGKDQINEFTVPMGVPVKLTLISEDVIHSLYIPAFRVKQDVLPNRYTSLWFTATEVGDFPIFCTQFCGLSHANMIAQVHVVKNNSNADVRVSRPAGEKLFQEKGCLSCHANTQNTPALAPTLKNLYLSEVELSDGKKITADETYLRESILNPNAKIVKGYGPIMPTYQGTLSEKEVRDLIDYLKSWRGTSP